MMRRKKQAILNPDAPLLHAAHKRPVSRRDFLAQGFMAGTATLLGGSALSMLGGSSKALAALPEELVVNCGLDNKGAGKIPFICFDLAGGANIAGSNVLVGGQGGQQDFLTTGGYNKLGLPGDMVPSITNPDTNTNDFVNTDFGLAFHSDSAFLRGMLEKTSAGAREAINGAVIPSRSDNDTGNNPHNPMYGINRYGSNGELLALIGSRSSDSGGNSMAPGYMINNSVRPTKIDRPSDATGLVDVGDLTSILSQEDAVAVMEAMQRISQRKLGRVDTQLGITSDEVVKELVNCGYAKSAHVAREFGNPARLDPASDPDIVGPAGIFSSDEFGDNEFRKTASVMKLVINGFAGAGTIAMGGYDYHTGDRATGEVRDLRAGRCMGACLEYAHRMGKPLMMYVFSDGSVASNGQIDNSEQGRGKGQWTGDNSSTGAAFFMVYNPGQRPMLIGANEVNQAMHQQIGYMRPDASVETTSSVGANNVTSLAEMVVLNYMALHGEQGQFENLFPSSVIKGAELIDQFTAFEPIVQGSINS